MSVIHNKDVRLKLKQHLLGLVAQIDVDLVDREIDVFYVGPLATTKLRSIDAKDQVSEFVMDDPDW